MRRTIIAAGVLMLLAWPAWAESHRIELKGADTETTTAEKVLHPVPGVGFTGDVHWDLEFDQNGGSVASESAFVHDVYPVNGKPAYQAIFNVETDETTVGKQFCIEYTGCALANGDFIGGCLRGLTPVPGRVIWTVPVTGNAFASSFVTALGTTDIITHGDGIGTTACTQLVNADCAHAKVRYRLRLNNNMQGCTNPSTNKLRIQWMETITTP